MVNKLVIGQTIVSLGTGPIKVKVLGLDFHMLLAFQAPTFKAFFFFFFNISGHSPLSWDLHTQMSSALGISRRHGPRPRAGLP